MNIETLANLVIIRNHLAVTLEPMYHRADLVNDKLVDALQQLDNIFRKEVVSTVESLVGEKPSGAEKQLSFDFTAPKRRR